jgi:hypothetical protein
VGETALFLHAAGRIEEGKSFAGQALSGALSPEHEAEVWLNISGMMAVSPDERAEAGRRALMLPGLSEELRARHLARLVHNLVVADRLPDAWKLLDEARDAVRSAGDATAASTLGFAEAVLGYMAGRFGPTLAQIEAVSQEGCQLNEPAREVMAARLRVELLAARPLRRVTAAVDGRPGRGPAGSPGMGAPGRAVRPVDRLLGRTALRGCGHREPAGTGVEVPHRFR